MASSSPCIHQAPSVPRLSCLPGQPFAHLQRQPFAFPAAFFSCPRMQPRWTPRVPSCSRPPTAPEGTLFSFRLSFHVLSFGCWSSRMLAACVSLFAPCPAPHLAVNKPSWHLVVNERGSPGHPAIHLKSAKPYRALPWQRAMDCTPQDETCIERERKSQIFRTHRGTCWSEPFSDTVSRR